MDQYALLVFEFSKNDNLPCVFVICVPLQTIFLI